MRAASLALRNGGPASVRRAIGWYRTYERLHCGDAITMAADALAAYRTDTAADRKSLLISDTTEMVDALNLRLHHDTVGANALTVAGARGHRIAVGDLIISCQNDNTIPLRNTNDPASEQNPVRNGNRWRVTAINPDNNGLIARRLDDNALASFPDDYLREHITHGYAVTVHSAQGVTADTTHAVLGDTATRSLLYVAMSRGRKTNSAYLYHRTAEYEYGQHPSEAAHVMQRGSSQAAGKLLRGIVANDDEEPTTAHDAAMATADDSLPSRVCSASRRRAAGVRNRRTDYERWRAAADTLATAMSDARGRDVGLSHTIDRGIDL